MKKSVIKFFTFCGLLLTLAAISAFAQENKPVEDSINKKPLRNFGKYLEEKIQKKQVDLAAPFFVELEGTLNQDGKLDIKKSGFNQMEGDVQMIEVAENAIEAINDSGVFIYLRQLGLTKIIMSVQQDKKQFSGLVGSLLESENRAKTIASGMNVAIGLGKKAIKDEDTLQMLNSTTVKVAGKDFSLIFAMPVEEFQALIQKQLDKKAK